MIAPVLERAVELRRDLAGDWHQVATIPCGECGCPWTYSIDDPGLWWDAGAEYSRDCSDLLCECHVAPSQGVRVSVRVR